MFLAGEGKYRCSVYIAFLGQRLLLLGEHHRRLQRQGRRHRDRNPRSLDRQHLVDAFIFEAASQLSADAQDEFGVDLMVEKGIHFQDVVADDLSISDNSVF